MVHINRLVQLKKNVQDTMQLQKHFPKLIKYMIIGICFESK